MRILVVGAGAVGGYFGGRLSAAGRDVTFLVRPRRKAQLDKTGLIIRSGCGNLELPKPAILVPDGMRGSFDLVIMTCKAYDLERASDAVAPAVDANTMILPLLNGMRHVEYLTSRFGPAAMLGGFCITSTTLDENGLILHLNDIHQLTFGEPDGTVSVRIAAVAAALSGAGFEARLSRSIVQEMWEKWVFIAATAGMSCLMRAAMGDIVAAEAADLTEAMLDECCGIAATQGFPPSEAAKQRMLNTLTAPGSTFAASMMRDMERGGQTEGEHIIGDLLRRGGAADRRLSLLRIAAAHLKAYQSRRRREYGVAQAA